ncbi:DUF6438 domain-containing protein [Tenacibaculum sp. M341]|uniref:DUF6438 domain-containing protein n=1 Tax=Tenacibaculum sp. M341 TaxID=2530339 RepID=UPI00104C546F|nr:DUF6438 domain-containing protein [Tenacibaculum sp. M341]TCI92710.1 hypothetical protein EYW44_07375 [Tenacibaculum sp. M341]
MKKSIFILFIIIEILGCTSNKTSIKKTLKEKIKGNWKTEHLKDKWDDTPFIFTFQDSVCSYSQAWGAYSPYWINGDTLNIKEQIIKKKGYIFGGKAIYQFVIDTITPKKLVLKPITNDTKDIYRKDKNDSLNKILLTKVKEQFNWRIERIAFYSSECYGSCPSMYLEIDSLGNLYFKGKYYTEKEGLFSGKLSNKNFENIKSKINSIDFNKLEKSYSANWTDDQTCTIVLKTKDTIYKSECYGFYKEPVALRILFHSLMELYKNEEIKQDSTIINEFMFKESTFYPPRPPVPPIPFNER